MVRTLARQPRNPRLAANRSSIGFQAWPPVTTHSRSPRSAADWSAASANPVTGADIEATLRMIATIIDEGFYCGDIEGDLSVPFALDLKGSTFAAVRIEDPAMLPLDVTVNCKGDTFRDKE